MTVKPYADGDRLPTGEILMWISLKSGCSIDWLLTGKGTRRIEINNIFTEEEGARVLAIAMVEAHEKI